MDVDSRPRPDRLSGLLQRFRVEARVFHSGAIRGTLDFAAPAAGGGHLHLVGCGRVAVADELGGRMTIDGPALLFYPRGTAHRLMTVDGAVAVDVVCAEVFLGGAANPVVRALPTATAMPMHASPALDGVAGVLFEEAFGRRCGRQAVLDRLCEVLVVRLLRHAIEQGAAAAGLLAGLAHPGLARALTVLHESPGETWTLERLAGVAGMSRTTFANTFRDVIGTTPGDYLAKWRLALARTLLAQRRPLKAVARQVGYASPAALSRAFSRHFGEPPRAVHRLATS
ncbi:AraC family transcriptional regulator [Shumkonia mesophila]|uniref:AraC family transcriptional regulator n=1 Tax=Shumkonia mesophila TaxID=2838854 RepID=UPI00293514E4|nr:AraC family transcriptional regulator [Shumkonia mesophila]